MRLNESILVRVAPVLLLALVAGPVGVRAQGAGSQGRAIDFSSTSDAGTNLFNQFFPSGSDAARAMGDDSFRSPDAMVPARNLNGMKLSPQRLPPPQAVQSKQLKALMEQKYWFLADTDGALPGTTPEEIYNLPDFDTSGRQSETLSPVERYLANQAAKKQEASRAKLESQQIEAARGINGIQRSLDPSNRGLNGLDSTALPGVPAVFVPQNATGYPGQAAVPNGYNPKPSAAGNPQKARMEEFNKMIGMAEADSPHTSPLTSPLNSGSPNSVSADWNPFSSSYQAAQPKKSALPVINANVAVPKPANPVVPEPAKVSTEEQYQPLFSPAFSMPRRRVQ